MGIISIIITIAAASESFLWAINSCSFPTKLHIVHMVMLSLTSDVNKSSEHYYVTG